MNTPLNHNWSFAQNRVESAITSPLKNAAKVMIPHCVDLYPVQYLNEAAYQREYTYQLSFDCKDALPLKFLRFDGVMLQFDAYLNGHSLGHFVSGYLPVEIEITEFIKPKGNLLTLFVDGREDPDIPPFGKVVDYLTYAGIYREVHLISRPLAYIRDLFVEAHANGRMHIHAETVGEAPLSFRLYDGEKLIEEFETDVFTLKGAHAWSLEDPHLYRLEARFGEDVKEVRVGFRDVEWKPQGFFLNGKRVGLVGLNRHQTYPYFGPAAPKSLQRDDAKLLKNSGINIVRTSHYPQSEHFLDACDEFGLLLVDEIPGWQFVGQNEKWRENCRDFCARMIQKERNHPCLVAYGLRIDESGDDDELYESIQKIKTELDPNRASLGVRNFKDSHCLEDIYAYNDFSCEDLTHGVDPSKELKGGLGKPLLISESNGHMFPTKPFDATDKRLEHALRHAKVLEDIRADKGYCGAITWCAFDYATHRDFGSGDHICHHGVYDIFRNPKYAASFFQSQGEENDVLEVASLAQPGDYNAALMPKIYCFTNADSVKLYRGDNYIGEFFPAKEEYPHLPHPPVIIDDIIGETFDEPNITKADAKKIVGAFNYCAQNGFSKLRIRDKVMLFTMMRKYKLDFTYVYQTYAKYVQSWGEGSSLWRFEAYKGGKKVATVLRGPSTDFHLDVQTERETLSHGDTYDCVALHLYKKDQFGTVMPYASDPISVETEAPIEVYGPRLFSLYGGASTVYVRSLPSKNDAEGILRIHYADETIERRFLVKQR